jgi:hypothetical protein
LNPDDLPLIATREGTFSRGRKQGLTVKAARTRTFGGRINFLFDRIFLLIFLRGMLLFSEIGQKADRYDLP